VFGWFDRFIFDKFGEYISALADARTIHDLDCDASAEDLRVISIAETRVIAHLPHELSLMRIEFSIFLSATSSMAMSPQSRQVDWVEPETTLAEAAMILSGPRRTPLPRLSMTRRQCWSVLYIWWM